MEAREIKEFEEASFSKNPRKRKGRNPGKKRVKRRRAKKRKNRGKRGRGS